MSFNKCNYHHDEDIKHFHRPLCFFKVNLLHIFLIIEIFHDIGGRARTQTQV